MDLKEDFKKLSSLDPQIRGKKFERFLSKMFTQANLISHLSYRPQGEEIDGAFWWVDRTILIEAKWISDPVAASSIYAFRGKVEGKFTGTIGLFISISGYSDDCISAVQVGKTQNILLYDKSDIEAILNGIDFTKMLQEKLYLAGRTGMVYTPWSQSQIAKRTSIEISKEASKSKETAWRSLLVICEGKEDRIILDSFLNYLQNHSHIKKTKINYLEAGGYHNIAGMISSVVASSLAHDLAPGIALLVVADSDTIELDKIKAKEEQFYSLLRKMPGYSDYTLLLSTPNIKSWLPQGTKIKSGKLDNIDWGKQLSIIPELKDLTNKVKLILF